MHATLRDPEPPLTRSVEDYLKAIYHLSSQGGFAATSDIATLLEVARPSVSGMVKRLSETGLIEHVPYRVSWERKSKDPSVSAADDEEPTSKLRHTVIGGVEHRKFKTVFRTFASIN